MDASSTATQASPLAHARRVDWSVVSAWLLGFGLIALLGLNGGGYDPLVHDQVGIAVWWIVLLGLLVGALPVRRLGAPAWAALGLLAAFALWTALSLTWTESAEKTAGDLARVAGYLGVFALALFARENRSSRHLIAAVASAVALIGLIGLLSRLHPAWFPDANQTGFFLASTGNRLSYPLHYWNALAALIAVGMPLLLQVATCARSVVVRSLSAAVVPALALAVYFTLARGGTIAIFLAVAIFLALAPDRVPKLLTTLVTGAGSAILLVAGTQRDALASGPLGGVARDQGNEMLAMTLLVCAGIGLLQAGISLYMSGDLRPRWSRFSRRVSLSAVVAGGVALLLAAAALGAPGRAGDAWDEFKQEGGPGNAKNRLQSASGNGRYQLWSSAARENRSEPLTGTGGGTFEYWWARDGTNNVGFVRDAHSLYLQTLGELGFVGLMVLGGFFLFALGIGARRWARAPDAERAILAAALAAAVALLVAAAFDWYWQMPVLPVALLLLLSVLVTGGDAEDEQRLSRPLRGGLALASLAAIVAIAIPLTSTALVRQSQAEAGEDDLVAALQAARDAQAVQPGAAGPRLQQALILEQLGNLPAAEVAARAAADREPTNWRNWLTLYRIEAASGQAADAVRHYRRARSLNPNSELFFNER